MSASVTTNETKIATTKQRWLYSLRYASSPDAGILGASDYRLFRPLPIEDDFLYQVRSWPEAKLDPALSAWRRRAELALPAEANPRARALAGSIAADAANPRQIVARVLALFNELMAARNMLGRLGFVHVTNIGDEPDTPEITATTTLVKLLTTKTKRMP